MNQTQSTKFKAQLGVAQQYSYSQFTRILIGLTLFINSVQSCIAGEYNRTWSVTVNGTKETKWECDTCSYACVECDLHSSHCLYCIPGLFFLSNGCYGTCPPGYRNRNTTLSCQACSEGCSRCIGGSSTECTACEKGLVLRKAGTCDLTCQEEEYADLSTQNSCRSCNPACKTCYGPEKNNCLTCQDAAPYVLPDKSCALECQKGQYIIDEFNKICADCHPNCKNCFGSYKAQCIECNHGKLLNLKRLCVFECEPGSYKLNYTHCAACSPGCEECTGPAIEQCKFCFSTLKKHVDSIFREAEDLETIVGISKRIKREKECNSVCKDGFYETGVGECERCHGTCLTCLGPTESECQNCVLNMTQIGGTQACQCITGYFNYGNVTSQRGGYCELCSRSCSLCGSPKDDDCSKCQDGFYLKNNACVRECGAGFYSDFAPEAGIPQTGYEGCLTCDPICLECSGPSKQECISCGGPHIKVDYTNGMNEGGDCFDCFRRFSELKAESLCREIRYINLRQESTPIDGSSSVSFLIEFEDYLKFRDSFSKIESNLTDYFQLRFNVAETEELLNPNNYTFNVQKIDSALYLNINFTTDGGIVNGFFSPKSPYIFIKASTGESSLIFPSKEVTFILPMTKQEDNLSIKNMENVGKQVADLIGFFGYILAGALGISIFSGGGGGAAIKMLRLFKVIYRFRLINIFFGNILNVFLLQMGDIFSITPPKWNDTDVLYFPQTRGKLTYYKVSPISKNFLFDKYLIFFLIKVLEIMEYHLKKKVRDATRLSMFDYIFVKLLDSIRSGLFLSSIYDIMLYSSHEILHHDLYVKQNSLVLDSYYQSCFIFVVSCFDLLRIGISLSKLNYKQIVKFEKSLLKVTTKIKLLQSDMKLLKKQLKKSKKKLKKSQRKSPSSPEQSLTQQNEEDSSQDSKKQNEGIKISENSTKRKIVKKEKVLKQLQTYRKYLISNWIYRIGGFTSTLLQGIKLSVLKPASYARYYRYSKVLKIVCFEIIIASLQTLPKIQIVLIVTIQSLSFISTIYYMRVQQIFKSFMWSFVEILSELSILFFLSIGLMMELEQREAIQFETWTRIQFLCIFFIVFCSIVNIVVMICSITGKMIWRVGAIVSYDGFFGQKWNNMRIKEINKVLAQDDGDKEEYNSLTRRTSLAKVGVANNFSPKKRRLTTKRNGNGKREINKRTGKKKTSFLLSKRSTSGKRNRIKITSSKIMGNSQIRTKKQNG